MYLADNNDTFPPDEHRQEVLDFFATDPGGGDEGCGYEADDHRTPEHRANKANPYLRWPVIFDEYVKNRDVWRCPSAKLSGNARFIIPGPDWVNHLFIHQGEWGDPVGTGPCYQNVFPSGWGGVVTDSVLQQKMAGPGVQGAVDVSEANKVFVQDYSTGAENFANMKMASYQDVARVPVVADGGAKAEFLGIATMAYPDICCAECSGVQAAAWGYVPGETPGWADPECYESRAHGVWAHDPALKNASTRHLGGSNIGWADGHASWVHAQRLCSMCDEGEIEGVGTVCGAWGTSLEGYRAACGEPPPGTVFLFGEAIDWYGNDTIK
jgi:prepilin-type processing-associated H-X9-DG protein